MAPSLTLQPLPKLGNEVSVARLLPSPCQKDTPAAHRCAVSDFSRKQWRLSRAVQGQQRHTFGSHCANARPKLRTQSARASSDGQINAASALDKSALFVSVKEATEKKDSDAMKVAMEALKEGGFAALWNSYPNVSRRQVFMRELTSMGIKNAEDLANPSVRNDLAFLVTVVGSTSVLAVLAGQLPGDWGFFVPYLLGSVSLVVLAIGSVAPGLLQVVINQFSGVFSDYQDRLLRHEAAHFLLAYMLGVPVVGYSLDIGQEHTNLVDPKLQKRIYEGSLNASDLDKLAVVSMAGLAAEGLVYDKVVGQSADLVTLQRIINRSKSKLDSNQQQNLTRWAVLYASSLLKNNKKAHEALMAAMAEKASIEKCIEAIEATRV